MKVCDSCQRVNGDGETECLECGGKEFQPLVFVEHIDPDAIPPAPFYNAIEPYQE